MSKQCASELIILAGGFGTRLQSVIKTVPKPMAPVGSRPFLEYVLDYWISQGIRRVVFSIGYLAQIIKTHFGQSYREATIDYVNEQKPLGTGGALRFVLDQVKWRGQQVVLVNGDTWFPANLEKLSEDADKQNAAITLTLKSLKKNDRYGGVIVDSAGKVKSFSSKPGDEALINAGCYLLSANKMRNALSAMPEIFSLENNFLSSFAVTDLVGASIQEEPFIDIGIPEDYQRACQYFK